MNKEPKTVKKVRHQNIHSQKWCLTLFLLRPIYLTESFIIHRWLYHRNYFWYLIWFLNTLLWSLERGRIFHFTVEGDNKLQYKGGHFSSNTTSSSVFLTLTKFLLCLDLKQSFSKALFKEKKMHLLFKVLQSSHLIWSASPPTSPQTDYRADWQGNEEQEINQTVQFKLLFNSKQCVFNDIGYWGLISNYSLEIQTFRDVLSGCLYDDKTSGPITSYTSHIIWALIPLYYADMPCIN